MPIKLIKKLAGKIIRKATGNKAVSPETAERPRKATKASAGSSVVVPGDGPAELWRPGDPVPPVKSSARPVRTPRSAQSSRTDRPPRSERAKDPGRDAAVVRSPRTVEREPRPSDGEPAAEGAENPDGTPRRRRSRGGRGRSRRPDGAAAEIATEAPIAGNDAPGVDLVPAAAPTAQARNNGPWTQADYVVEPADGKLRFQDAELPDTILHALADLGFKYCTPIQARVLQEVTEGHNVAGKAQTGTGKTAAFLLLAFKQFLQNPPPADRSCGKPRALVLAPTRELVIQIVNDAQDIGKYCGMQCVAVYGGTDYDRQERELLTAPVDLIAATPGRLLDFCRKGNLDLSSVEVLVIDEADRMLDMGFIPDVRTIIRKLPPKDQRRTLLFSATLSDDVMRLAAQWMPDPHVVEVEPDQVAVDTVKQLVYMVRAQEKFTVLYNLLKRPTMGRVLVFANRRDQTDRIAFELKRYGIDCEILSGAVDQKKRMRVLEDFRSGKVKTVVATDVAGRGLHVDEIDHVVNFDLPYEAEDYVHRIGRTGRAGAQGTAVSFACEDESFGIPEIEAYMGESMSCKYPEDILLRPLPHTQAAGYVRPPRSGGSGSGGGRRGGPGGGGHDSARRRPR
ncbi:MAG TPA: ATP-dependent RNA helicase RhlB [Verrucomicrobia bacterium]|nr:ATP-dependent RNA helicase RhlB [Verrucomicrobiota bacterium]